MRCPACGEYLPDIDRAHFCPSCGAHLPEEADRDPLIDKLVGGRFRITELVAEGGMGRIYAAEQQMGTTARKVAIKMLLAEFASRSQDVARFMRECSTVCELEHPNTIKFYDYGQTEDGDLFIAMEFLTGENLAVALRRDGEMPPERVDWIMSQLCGSLAEAHEKGIIHRDLKPDNILITTPAGEPDIVKVLDFGIAKRPGGREQKLTPLGVVLGSPPYMSPEQFSLQDIDHKSDIYSLAIVAYQMLSGHLPFKAKDMLQWATLHMTEPPAPMEMGRFGPAPDPMREAIMQALAKDPADRPASVRDFYEMFTIGAGRSMPPPRGSSFPSPPKVPGVRPSSEVNAASDEIPPLFGSGGPAREPNPAQSSSAQASSDAAEPDGSAPPGAASSPRTDEVEPARGHVYDEASTRGLQYGKQGTIAMPSNAPHAIEDSESKIPELVPPTVRDPSGQAPRSRRRRAWWPWVLVALGALLVGGGLVAIGVFEAQIFGDEDGEASDDEGKKASKKKRRDADASPLMSSLPDLSSTVLLPPPPASVSVDLTKPQDPCEVAITAALAGDCEASLNFRKNCPEDHPDHQLAHRAFEKRCQP